MTTPEMLGYIKRQQEAGKSREEIMQALRQSGWQEADIQSALGGAPAPGNNTAALPPASQILKTAWEIYMKKFWLLIGIAAVPAAVAAAFALIFGASMLFFLANGKFSPTPALNMAWPVIMVLALAFIAIMAYLGIWSTGAGIIAIQEHRQTLGFKETFRRARPLIGKIFITGLLAGLAILGGFILLIIPGVIFALWFSQSTYIVIQEGLSGSEALSKSKTYIKGRMGEVFLKFLFIGVVIYGSVFVATLIDGGIASGLGKNSQEFSLLSNVLSFALAPLATAYGFVLYKHLKGEQA